MKLLLIDNGSSLLEKLKALIPGHEISIGVGDFKAETANDFDVVILSGSSKYSVVENLDLFSQEIEFITHTTKPVIGICLGFELIAKAYGGKLKKMTNKDVGVREIEILNNNLISKTNISVFENHIWTVDSLPDVFEVLAKSIVGPEIIKHITLPIYGFQFHPENLTDKTNGDEIFLRIFSQFK